MRRCKLVVGLVCAAGVMLGSGCGQGRPKLVKVSGQILIDGQPLPKAAIQVLPQGGRPATATSDEQGRFTLTTFESGDGVMPGTHPVIVVAITNPKPGLQTLYCPEKYGDPATSDLKLTVDKPTDQAKIELTWGGLKGPIMRKVDTE